MSEDTIGEITFRIQHEKATPGVHVRDDEVQHYRRLRGPGRAEQMRVEGGVTDRYPDLLEMAWSAGGTNDSISPDEGLWGWQLSRVESSEEWQRRFPDGPPGETDDFAAREDEWPPPRQHRLVNVMCRATGHTNTSRGGFQHTQRPDDISDQ